MINSNRHNKLNLGVGFKAKARASADFINWGEDVGVSLVGGVCVTGWVFVFIWLGCVKRMVMYWEGGRR